MNYRIPIRLVTFAFACANPFPLAHADESLVEIRKTAEKGDPEAQNKMGHAYLRGKEVPPGADEAFRWFQKSADQSNADSQYWVGSLQTRGIGTRKNPEEGLKWILKSANQDHGGAQLFLGMKYMEGEEAFDHHQEAFEWLTKAASHKIPMACFYLGSYHLSGVTGDRDMTEAVKWLKMAADECQPNSQFTLGMLYIGGKDGGNYLGLPIGVGVEQNLELGCMYLNLATASGYLIEDSGEAWGKLQDLAKTVPPEQLKAASIKARNWAKDAADRGNPIAQYEVGMMYFKGFCFPKDLARACLYGMLALESDETRGAATYFISDVKREISPAQLEESQRLLDDWRTAHAPSRNLPAGVKSLPVNGFPMAYAESGRGPTVVLVHGALADYRYWGPQLVSLSPHMRIVAVSLRHHFPEHWDGKGGEYSLQTHAGELAGFIKALDCGPVDLVGHSRGGAVAAMTAATHPDLLRRLVLAEPAILSLLPEAAGNAARAAQVKHLNERFVNGDTEGALEFFIDSVNAPGTWKSRPEPFRQIARDNAWTISRQATDIETMGVAGMAQMKMPVLLIGGEKSPRMFSGILDAIHKALPSATRETLPDAGHQVSRDNPTAFDRALAGFLTK